MNSNFKALFSYDFHFIYKISWKTETLFSYLRPEIANNTNTKNNVSKILS